MLLCTLRIAEQVSISPIFYVQLLRANIPKWQKQQSSQAAFCALGSVGVKVARKHVDENAEQQQQQREISLGAKISHVVAAVAVVVAAVVVVVVRTYRIAKKDEKRCRGEKSCTPMRSFTFS